MVLEPPHTLNGTHIDPSLPPRWRQMKYVQNALSLSSYVVDPLNLSGMRVGRIPVRQLISSFNYNANFLDRQGIFWDTHGHHLGIQTRVREKTSLLLAIPNLPLAMILLVG